MPKFIGNSAPSGAKEIENNAKSPKGFIRISYSQMVLLPPDAVLFSLDTTDRGGPKSLAKRWYRWFGRISAIETEAKATPKMKSRASKFKENPSKNPPVTRQQLALARKNPITLRARKNVSIGEKTRRKYGKYDYNYGLGGNDIAAFSNKKLAISYATGLANKQKVPYIVEKIGLIFKIRQAR